MTVRRRKKRNYAKAYIVARISTLTPFCLGTKQVPPVRLLRVLFAESRMSCGLNDIFIPRQEKKTCTSTQKINESRELARETLNAHRIR